MQCQGGIRIRLSPVWSRDFISVREPRVPYELPFRSSRFRSCPPNGGAEITSGCCAVRQRPDTSRFSVEMPNALTDCRAGHSANNNNSTNHNNNNNTNMIAIITNLICAMLHWALTVLAMVPRLCYTAGLWVSAAQAASDRRQRVWEGQWRQREAARLRAEREAAQAEEYWRLQLASGQQQRERPTGESQFEVSKALALVFVQGSNKPSRSHDDRESDPTRRRYISISYDANLKCSHYSTLSFHLNQWGPLKAFGSPRMLIWPPTGTPNLLRAARPLPGGYALSTKLCKRRSGGASASSWPRTGGRGATASLRGPIRHRYFDIVWY
jgi:hypothetical protein